MSRMKVAWEQVKAKDLQVGDIVKMDRWYQKLKTGVVTKVSIVPVAERWPHEYGDPNYYTKKAMRRVLVTFPNGSSGLIGWDMSKAKKGGDYQLPPEMTVERQCSKEAAAAKEHQDEILRYRVGVRTVLSTCETDLRRWSQSHLPKNGKLLQQLDSYRNDYMRIFELLDALDARMTKDAGRTDVRKPVHPHGRRRN